MARIAASLTLAGVSKSGSPAPRPMTLRPAAFSSRALSVTAIVADGFTRSSAADRKDIIGSRFGVEKCGRHGTLGAWLFLRPLRCSGKQKPAILPDFVVPHRLRLTIRKG